MAWLLDTNIVSELRKGNNCNRNVRTWHDSVPPDDLFLSVLVLGEIQRGIENIRRRDPAPAQMLDAWLSNLPVLFGERLLPVTAGICGIWGRFSQGQPIPDIDGLIAATALHHGLTVATRNTNDFLRTGVPCFNPFGAEFSRPRS
jgi:predicted nucleic acid-binding protein